ncbi:MAG: hypothetical protein Q4D51_03510 [Eubacteriales bacterium]|nr:hypothetical protein [Eubacteriales bacterium]
MDNKKDMNQNLNEQNPEFAALQQFFGENVQKEADFIGAQLDVDPELVQKVLDSCEEFSAIAEGNPEYIVEELDEDGIPVKMISGDKMYAFISEQTGVAEDLLDQIFDAEVDYFEQFGLVE